MWLKESSSLVKVPALTTGPTGLLFTEETISPKPVD
jgi:hypothetical protein